MDCNHEWYQGKCVHCEATPNQAKENAELRAQLARCVDVLEAIACLGNGDRHGNSEGNTLAIKLLESLPKIAAQDAEILKCVNNWYYCKQEDDEQTSQELGDAVRAKETNNE